MLFDSFEDMPLQTLKDWEESIKEKYKIKKNLGVDGIRFYFATNHDLTDKHIKNDMSIWCLIHARIVEVNRQIGAKKAAATRLKRLSNQLNGLEYELE